VEVLVDTNILAAPAIEGLLFLLQTPLILLMLHELLFFGAGVKEAVKVLANLKPGIALVSKRSCHKKQTRTCHDAGGGQKRPKGIVWNEIIVILSTNL